jgi:pyruvate/2-oxoglutarate dehydrogenase complex dihydrolipoamide acyltransferase (E2) component
MVERVRGWRKLAGSTWRAPDDPQFFGDLEIDATALRNFVLKVRESSGVRLTVTHLIGRAVAHAFTQVPELSVRLVRGRVYPRESIGIFFIVSTENGRDLTGVKIEHVDRKSAVDVATELAGRTASINRGEDAAYGRSKTSLARFSPRVLRHVLRLAAWLTSDLNLDLSRFGMPRQAFGGAMISSVGMWGVSKAYTPLAGYYKVPLIALVGAVKDRPVVVDGEVVARPMLTVTATFDHRYADGAQASRMADAVLAYCADPEKFEPTDTGTETLTGR